MWLERDVELLCECKNALVIFADPLTAHLAYKLGCLLKAVRPHTASGTVARFEDGDIPARRREPVGRCETGKSGTDNDAGVGRLCSFGLRVERQSARCNGRVDEKGAASERSENGLIWGRRLRVLLCGVHCAAPIISGVEVISGIGAGPASSPAMSRCEMKIAATEKTKMIVEMAFISGVAPRRSRDHISSGSVFSRPIRKKVTAISSIESVKTSRAVPSSEVCISGSTMRHSVCRPFAPRSDEASSNDRSSLAKPAKISVVATAVSAVACPRITVVKLR